MRDKRIILGPYTKSYILIIIFLLLCREPGGMNNDRNIYVY